MKSLLSMIFEAGIPSKITKKKTNIIKKTNRYKFGDDDADTIKTWFGVGVQYSRYDGFNDKFKKFLESVKVTKDNFYTIMPIQNMKTRPNAVYNFN